MTGTLRICYTSDLHGYLFPTLYADRAEAPVGLMKLMDAFPRGENTLILDGGDTLQGSPLTNLYHRLPRAEQAACLSSPEYGRHPVAAVMNLAGYQFVTLGNHDFNYGLDALEDYLQNLDAICLCANIRDRAHRLPIAPYAVTRMENGLRVGLAGVCTHDVARWEKPETAAQLEIEDGFEAARRTLEDLRGRCDLTVLIYHGGYECDLETDRPLTDTTENQACRICRELDYDVVLTGHQHMPVAGRMLHGSYTIQPGYRAPHACLIEAAVEEDGSRRFSSRFIAPAARANEAALRLLAPLEEKVQAWLDTPAGRLSRPLPALPHLWAALHGNPLANFINDVQLRCSGAQVSACAMPNEYKGFPQEITVRDVVSTYIYSNTMAVLGMDRDTLKAYMEHSAEYFDLDGGGRIVLGGEFTRPKLQHYNYDYFAGVDYVIDVRRPVGDRITSIRIGGRELGPGETVSVCVNSYRRGGTGGYEMVSRAPLIREIQTDIADAIIETITSSPDIRIDGRPWATVLPEQPDGT